MNYSKLTVKNAVAKIKNKEISSEELVRYHLSLANTLGKDLNAFITVIDDALDKAKGIDKAIQNGGNPGRLAGVPFTVKDVYMTEDIETTAASKLLQGFIAPYTATVIKRLEDEGAINIGKTNCDPFAYGGSGENSGYGPTLNPIDKTRVPGGSSSGAAASLAAGIGLFALGTDTGGSVRQPASFCGLVGFKPTYGRNSRYGLIAMASSFDTAGILTHSIEDLALIEEIMAGQDIHDATTYDIPVENYSKSISENLDLSQITIGMPKEYLGEGIDPQVKTKVVSAIKKLEKFGATIKEISIPLLEYGIPVYYILVPSEISSNMARYDGVRFGPKLSTDYEKNMFGSRGKYMEDEVKRRVMMGTYILSEGYSDRYYHNALKVRVKLTQQIDKVFNDVDVIMGPTVPTTAFKLGEKTNDPISMYLSDIYTVTANLVGTPGLSINCGEDDNGLPIGLQMMTRRFSENLLFKIGYKFEQIKDR